MLLTVETIYYRLVVEPLPIAAAWHQHEFELAQELVLDPVTILWQRARAAEPEHKAFPS